MKGLGTHAKNAQPRMLTANSLWNRLVSARVKGVEAGGNNVLTEKREATTLSHVSSVPILLENALRDRQVGGLEQGHRWTRVPFDLSLDSQKQECLSLENETLGLEYKTRNPEDQILAAPNAYNTRNGAHV